MSYIENDLIQTIIDDLIFLNKKYGKKMFIVKLGNQCIDITYNKRTFNLYILHKNNNILLHLKYLNKLIYEIDISIGIRRYSIKLVMRAIKKYKP